MHYAANKMFPDRTDSELDLLTPQQHKKKFKEYVMVSFSLMKKLQVLLRTDDRKFTSVLKKVHQLKSVEDKILNIFNVQMHEKKYKCHGGQNKSLK